ncbi:MAG: AAA family ATPase [Clostridia bacterium]|nr:AAA family ATPase [Clostridia bacterium]
MFIRRNALVKNIHRIVLTGGPCAGKTTAFARIETELTNLGYKVFVMPETFTEMYGGGIKLLEYPNVEFQDMLFRLQRAKEHIYDEAAEKCETENVVILYDRGLVDALAYTSPEDTEEILRRNKVTINTLMNMYDAVIHMVTAADGAAEAYIANKENNPARYESVEDAIKVDHALKNAWTGHPHLRIVDNSTDFANKINRMMAEIFAVLGEPVPLEIEKKFLIKAPVLANLSQHINFSEQQIIQTYLCDNGNGIERRIRMRGTEGDYTFFYTEKKFIRPGVRVETERKISEREYINYLMQTDCQKRQIRKTRYCFIYNNLYYELDVYPFWEDKAILEIELSSEASNFEIPDFISPIKDVTDNPAYSNYMLASKIPD